MTRSLLLLLLAASVAAARPPYRKALADLLELPAASPLNDCLTCHLPGTDDERPHNPFGARLKAVRAELRKAGKDADITSRLLAIADEAGCKLRVGTGGVLQHSLGPVARALIPWEERPNGTTTPQERDMYCGCPKP